jgi:thymidylate kinase
LSKGAIVCFTGMDGSGKTSHAVRLIYELESKGVACGYTWCRWFPGFADPFHFIARRILGITRREFSSYRPLRLTYEFLIIFDFLRPILFKVRLPAKLGRCVIIDRYIYDRLADLAFLGYKISNNSCFVKVLTATNPKPDITFWIDVPPAIAVARKNDMSLREAQKYSEIYRVLARSYHFRRVINVSFRHAHDRIVHESFKILQNHHSG